MLQCECKTQAITKCNPTCAYGRVMEFRILRNNPCSRIGRARRPVEVKVDHIGLVHHADVASDARSGAAGAGESRNRDYA